MRQEILDGTEVVGGYARAVRKGTQVHVSGTTSIDAEGTVVGDDAYAQTKEVYRKLLPVLGRAGATLQDVVRIVAYITDIGQAEGFARAHAEVFAAVRPAATLVEVSGLMRPEMIVEIELYAVVDEEPPVAAL